MFSSLKALFGRPLQDQAPRGRLAALRADGDAALARGNLPAAMDAFQAALALAPGDAATLLPLGHVMRKLGRVDEAISWLKAAVSADSSSIEARYLLALVLQEQKRPPEAIVQLEAILAIDPSVADAYFPLFDAYLEVGRRDAAHATAERGLECFRRALDADPDNADLLSNCGVLLRELSRPEEAVTALDSALRIRPDFAQALNNRGLARFDLERFEEAIADYDRALEIDEGLSDVHVHRGHALRELLRHEEALAAYARAQAIATQEDIFFNQSLSRLVLGDLPGGWPHYEWRWQVAGRTHPKSQFAIPLWLGAEDLSGKTIFLYAEQGLGDTIQMCRYARCVADLGATVILGVQKPLIPILEGLDGVSQLIALGPEEPVPLADFHCPLLSLPLAFGTSLQTIPCSRPYLPASAARSSRRAAWQARLGVHDQPRIGLVWSGNADHKNDRNRSIGLTDFLAVVAGGARFIVLQKEIRPIDAPLLKTRPELEVFAEHLVDFGETAALIEQLDLVVSVDTSVAHLAAAMGKPVWLLLPFNPDWRWLLIRDDTPWYERVRLFRQTRPGDWSDVLTQVASELARFVAAPDPKVAVSAEPWAATQKNPSAGR